MADLSSAPSLIGVIATGIMSILIGVTSLRKYLSRDAVDRAGDKAQLEIISMLRRQVMDERNRADAATLARDEALTEIRQLKDQIAKLTLQVQNMQTQLSQVQTTVSKANP